MLLTIIHLAISLSLSVFFGYLLYVNVGPWYSLIAVAFIIPVFYVLYLITLLLLYLTSLILKRMKAPERPSRFFYYFLRENDILLSIIARVKILLTGEELIPQNQRYLIVTNHRSNFDQIVMIRALKDHPMVYVSKPENFRVPIMGAYIRAAGFIPINRDSPIEGAKSIHQAIDIIKEDAASVAICPEGTRNKTREPLLPFHPGSFQIAMQSHCPIVIASINGANQVHKRFPWRSTKVRFSIIETLYPEDYAGKNSREIANYATELIQKQLDKEGLIL